ncbi:cytochrome D ubiquinol oxidase subunit II (plasmid) [Borreliella garinii]|uniref:Decorin binding protein A n=1 Tax=Borreliella garinii TaxID=29519 RepID=Q9ZH88_BORGR|nr:decorin-binding protein DbpA [Borreliella garinii]AAC70055.1 decorin binding protein A [Borreliella garinii]APQ15588.1 cytochrome D ubiquinol oxidase subunit II [Borreliella garinii]AZA28336.1 cytochrome D ubiquinol oxidase subunit II [Borreliella garinii]
MTKYIKNLLKLSLIVSLLVACGLTGETKIRLESSAQEIKDEINKIKANAKKEGVNFEAFTNTKTGSRVSEKPEFILKAKIQAIQVAEKFVKAIKEEAEKLKNSGSSGAFSAMYDLMLDVSKPLEEIGIQKMTGTVTQEAEKTPATTAEGILAIAQAMEEKLKNVNKKQHEALKNLQGKANATTT